MGEIRLPGLSTGIDTTTLIQQLVSIESRQLTAYQTRISELQQQNSALEEIRSLVTAFNSTVSSISDTSKLTLYDAVSSDTDFLEVSATSNATPGSHSVEINRLASSETWVHNGSTFNFMPQTT